MYFDPSNIMYSRAASDLLLLQGGMHTVKYLKLYFIILGSKNFEENKEKNPPTVALMKSYIESYP